MVATVYLFVCKRKRCRRYGVEHYQEHNVRPYCRACGNLLKLVR